MIKIKINEPLLFKHRDEIATKILQNIQKECDLEQLNQNISNCLQYLCNINEIKNLLISNSIQMQNYKDFFSQKFPNGMVEGSKLNKILREKIFEKEYNNWGNRTTYGAYHFVQTLDLKSCPYCNRNYTFTVVNSSGKMRPQIDHFYPKSKYPFFAMSFFNLIPSCPSCNHTKSSIDEQDLINPYDISAEDLSFTYIPNSIDFAIVEREKYNFDSFNISVKGNQKNREIFKLDELYEQHKDIVLELLIKKAYYPKSYVKELEGFGFNADEIYRYLLCNYSEDKDLHKRPLSKLIKDISKELDLY